MSKIKSIFSNNEIKKYYPELKEMLKNDRIIDLDRELDIYRKNMDLLCEMLSLAEIKASDKRLNLTTIQTIKDVVSKFSDPDIKFSFDLDFNKYAYLYFHYKDKKLDILKQKYDILMIDYVVAIVNYEENYVRDEAVSDLIKKATKNDHLKLGSINDIKQFVSSIAKEVINLSDVSDEIKMKIIDGLIKEFNGYGKSYEATKFLTEISKDEKYASLINEYSEYKKKDKDKVLNKMIESFESIIHGFDPELYELINKFIKFDNEKDENTGLEISPEVYIANKINIRPVNKILGIEDYNNRDIRIKDNDIIALLYNLINNNYERFNMEKFQEIISLPSFRLNEINVSFVLGILEDLVQLVINTCNYTKEDFEYIMNDGLRHYNSEINKALSTLYSKVKFTDEENNSDEYSYEELHAKVNEFNSKINSKVENFYTDIYRKESLEKIFTSLLGKTRDKINEEYDKKYGNGKVSKKLKQVLTVNEVLEDKIEGEE